MIPEVINSTIIPAMSSASAILIEQPLTPYPLWHLLFWISPYFAGYWGGGWFLLVSYIVSKLTASGKILILIDKINLNLF